MPNENATSSALTQEQYDQLVAKIVGAVPGGFHCVKCLGCPCLCGSFQYVGRHITLEDVIRACPSLVDVTYVSHNNGVALIRCKGSGEHWLLGKPLSEQGDGCKRFLFNLFVEC